MSETPTDRVELTDARCGYTVTDVDGNEEPCDLPATGHRWYQDVGEHEDLLDVACDNHRNEGGRLIASLRADLQALTAERDDLRQTVRANSDTANQRSMSISAELVKNAALQRLADESRAELAAANDRIAELTELFDGLRDDYQKACEEVERLQHHDWEDENAALQATLDRVTALADEWNRDKPPRTASVFGRALRSAISGDGA